MNGVFVSRPLIGLGYYIKEEWLPRFVHEFGANVQVQDENARKLWENCMNHAGMTEPWIRDFWLSDFMWNNYFPLTPNLTFVGWARMAWDSVWGPLAAMDNALKSGLELIYPKSSWGTWDASGYWTMLLPYLH